MDFGGGSGGSDAISSGMEQYAAAINNAISAQKEAVSQYRTDVEPWRTAGQSALNQYGGLLGLSGYSAVDPTTALRSTPGYQWTLSQGIGALDKSAAAKGLLTSGAQQKGLLNYAEGLADTTYQSYLGNVGKLASGGLSAASGMGTSSMEGASNISNLYSNLGSTELSSALAKYASSQQGSQNLFKSLLGLGGFGMGLYSSGALGGMSDLFQYGLG